MIDRKVPGTKSAICGCIPPAVWRVLGDLWTLPNTLLGLWIGLLLARGLPRRARGHDFWIFDAGCGISPRVKAAGPWATTFGAIVVFWEPSVADDEAFLRHEAWHVRQYRHLGPFFLPLYLLFLPFTGWREQHPLERNAYRTDRSPTSCLAPSGQAPSGHRQAGPTTRGTPMP